jgi:hypothetical protein
VVFGVLLRVQVEVFSDYDTEFIESEQNHYNTYYFNDSDTENTPLMPSESAVTSASAGATTITGQRSGGANVSAGASGKAQNRRGSGAFQIDADERI